MTIDQRKIDSIFDNWRRKSFIRGDEFLVRMNQERRILFVCLVTVLAAIILIMLSVDLLLNIPLGIILCGVVTGLYVRYRDYSFCFRRTKLMVNGEEFPYSQLKRIEYGCEYNAYESKPRLVLYVDNHKFVLYSEKVPEKKMDAVLYLLGSCFKPIFINELLYEDMIRLCAYMISLTGSRKSRQEELQCVLNYFAESNFAHHNFARDLSRQIDLYDLYNAQEHYPKGTGYVDICLSILKNRGVDYDGRVELLSRLFECAYASDGMVDEAELERLSRIAFYLRIKDWDFLSLKYRFEAEKQQHAESKQREDPSGDQQHSSENQKQRERYQSVCSSRKREAYNLLGLKPDASLEEVKSAYRTQVKTCHPDTLPPTATEAEREEATIRFRTITEAYDFLCAELSAEPVNVTR